MKHKVAQTEIASTNPPPTPHLALACAAILLLWFFTVYLLRLDPVIGMVGDDAWYVLLAKALATGEGYQMINAPTPGIRPITPPVFPALLALVWRLWPDFPTNLWLLKTVSLAAMLGTGLVAFYYFKRCRALPLYLALGLAAATVFYPALVFHATSMVMTECVFLFAQLSAIVVIERSVQLQQTRAAWPEAVVGQAGSLSRQSRDKIPACPTIDLGNLYAVLGGALAAAAYLIRSAGAGLLVAAVFYLLKERCPRQALIVGLIVALSAGAWLGYARAHAPTPEQRAEQASSILQPYGEQFWQRVAGAPSAGTITVSELPGRVWQNLAELSRVDLGAVPLYLFYRALAPGEVVQLSRVAVWCSLVLTALTIVGFVTMARARLTLAEFVVPLSLAVTLLWAWEQFRFLLPLIPFLLFYQLMGVGALLRLFGRLGVRPRPHVTWVTLTVIVWLVAALNVYANVLVIQKQYAPHNRTQWQSDFAENAALFLYVNERLPKDAVLATYNPALTYLFTGRKTVALGDPANSWERWRRLGVRYLVYAAPNPLPSSEPFEGRFQTLYRQHGRLNLRVLDLGPPSTRPAWGQ